MGIRLGVVLAAPLLVLTGCGDSGADAGAVGRTVPDLDGTSWIATTITDKGRAHRLAPGTDLRVEFSGGSISVNAGCNTMGGPYSLSADSELSTESLQGTEMGCEPALMDQDAWLSDTVFARPLVAAVEGTTLTLSRDDLEVVLVDRAVGSPDAVLEGTAWQLEGVRAGETVSSISSGSKVPTLVIGSDGSVTLHTGCNGGRGTAMVSDRTIAFGPIATTKMACADAAGQQTEAAVLAVLREQVEWSITEQVLTLTRGDRGLVYRATP